MKYLVILLTLLSGGALAHESQSGFPYPPECCGGHDCHELPQHRVRAVPGGYLIDGKHFVAHKDVRVFPDGKYHACWHPTPDRLHCFFAPDLGS